MSIKITCNSEEKWRILKALTDAHVCPFKEDCSHVPKGNFGFDHRMCKEENIEWTITDEPDKSNGEGKHLTKDDVMMAGAKALASMIIDKPMLMLMHDDFVQLAAMIAKELFNKEEK